MGSRGAAALVVARVQPTHGSVAYAFCVAALAMLRGIVQDAGALKNKKNKLTILMIRIYLVYLYA